MVTTEQLQKKIGKYKEEIGKLGADKVSQPEGKTLRKGLKRSQRKLKVLERKEQRLSAGKKEDK